MNNPLDAPVIDATPATVKPAASRYVLADHAMGRAVTCESAPNIFVLVHRGETIDQEGRQRLPNQSIFLDGYFSGPPFLDNERRQYSFDHHAGDCPRAFLLSACEQTVVMVLHGLPLDDGEWLVFINDPDLDAVLAAWVLLNHHPLRQNHAKVLFDVMPLIRVEGVIDAHGTDMPALAGLSLRVWEHYEAEIDALRTTELELKKAGKWAETDFAEYVKSVFDKLDERLLPASHLQEITAVKELGRAILGQGKMAILCSSRQGIYAVEERLKERFGPRLAIIVLDPGDGRVVLRQVDPFLPKNLTHIYELLNQKDQNAKEQDLWGGSSDIGGSPRKAGSGLTGKQVLAAVSDVFGVKRAWWRKILDPKN
jgi:hypothetical protein